VHFVWLMGSDNLENFGRWRRWPEIVRSVPIAVVTRPGASVAPLHSKALQRFAHARVIDLRNLPLARPPAIAVLDGHRCAQSASAIRAECLRGEGLVRMVPAC
jgi:nicotinate-nucleotide adenylyltransferase